VNQNNEDNKWPLWVAPTNLVWDYALKVIFVLFLLPYLFGLILTVPGLFINFLIVDLILYSSYKARGLL